MKRLILLLFLLTSTFVFSQTKIKIDTLKINFRVDGIVEFTSVIPQIDGDIPPDVITKVNADIKSYFMATVHKDSVRYVKNLLEEYSVPSLAEYFKQLEQGNIVNTDSENESFQITYLSDHLLNFTYSHSILPTGGRPMATFTSVIYDLHTGKKLDFNDFFSIDSATLISIFRKEGYHVSWRNDDKNPFELLPIDANDEYVESLNDLYKPSDRCVQFYFERIGNDLHLKFTILCAGPQLQDYGMPLKSLKPYIKHNEFKNEYKLWGKDINALKGYDYWTLGETVHFEDYTLNNTGSGYKISNEDHSAEDDYAIMYANSSVSIFYLFLKYEVINNVKRAIIIDVLEIEKKKLEKAKLTEYCETKKGFDSEILALVKDANDNPEYYTKIIKAWRANRKTGKFEVIGRKAVRRCGNEGFGF